MNITMAIDIRTELSAAGRDTQKRNKKMTVKKTKKLKNFVACGERLCQCSKSSRRCKPHRKLGLGLSKLSVRKGTKEFRHKGGFVF